MASKFTHRPLNYIAIRGKEPLPLQDEHLRISLDRDMGRIYDAHASLNSTAVKAPAFGTGFATNSGNTIITGSKLNIPTSLSKVDFVVASISTGSTPNAYTISAGPSMLTPGTIDIYVWQPTSATVTTPIAATAAVLVHWTATGQAETTT